jgi:hypothetical protein
MDSYGSSSITDEYYSNIVSNMKNSSSLVNTQL